MVDEVLLLQVRWLRVALLFCSSRKKLTQLQHAYTCLFKDYDSKLKNEVKLRCSLTSCPQWPRVTWSVCLQLQGGDLCSRLEEAERALALKQDLIDKLKEEVERQKGSLETVPVLTAQVRIRPSPAQEHRNGPLLKLEPLCLLRLRSIKQTSWQREKPERS